MVGRRKRRGDRGEGEGWGRGGGGRGVGVVFWSVVALGARAENVHVFRSLGDLISLHADLTDFGCFFV